MSEGPLYVGVTVEAYRGTGTNHGWSIPETLYNAIRNDAISSGLGDQFHTDKFDAEHLTPWGYEHALGSGRLAVLVARHTKIRPAPHADIYRVASGDTPAPAKGSESASQGSW